jgi:hypothetical protein
VAVPVDAAAAKVTVTHHALAEQKESDYQAGDKQDESNLVPGRLLLWRGWRLGLIGHRRSLLSR